MISSVALSGTCVALGWKICAQELYCGHVAVVEFRQSRHEIVCGDML